MTSSFLAGWAHKVRLHRKFDLHVEPDGDQPLPTLAEALAEAKRTTAFYRKQASTSRRAAQRATMNVQAAVHEGQAQLLKTLFHRDAKKRLELYQQFRNAGDGLADALFFRAQAGDARASLELSSKADFLIHRLYELAKGGNRPSAEMLAEITVRLVGKLNALALTKPEMFESVAKARYNWPVLKSVHPHLGEDERKVLEALNVGHVYADLLGPESRWNPKRPACGIAFKLLLHVASHRERLLAYKDELARGVVETLPDWALQAMKLPLFYSDNDTIAKWWAVAAKAFDEAYPSPEKVPELMQLLTAQSHLKSPASRIKQKIEEAFDSLAGYRKANPRRHSKNTAA